MPEIRIGSGAHLKSFLVQMRAACRMIKTLDDGSQCGQVQIGQAGVTERALPCLISFESTMSNLSAKSPRSLTTWQLALAGLSVYVLVAVAADSFLTLSSEVTKLLNFFDTLICFLFLGDFIFRFFKAENRLAFMKWGWIDLLSSIPNLDMFRWGRMISVARLFRLLRAVRSFKLLGELLMAERAKAAFAVVVVLGTVLIASSSILILEFEQSPRSNIKDAADALWWSLATVTTVGYGDCFPVTNAGRILGCMLMVFGIALFGTFTAAVGSLLLGGSGREAREVQLLALEVKRLREEIVTSKTPNPGEPVER